MRNLKRALSLALAAMMLIGMMVVSAGAASKDFTDKDEIKNTEAVNVMVALNVISGKEDGSYFDPNGTLTRAEMAKIISYVMNGGVEPVLGTKDVPTYSDIDGHWAEAYIEYCTSMGIIVGDGAGKFNPEGTLTGTQAAKMFLTAMGYNAEVFGFVGNSWATNTDRYANEAGLYDELGGLTVSAPISRDNAAQMAYNAIQATMMRRTWSQDMTTGQLTETYAPWVEGTTVHTLLGEKFDASIEYGYMTGISYDEDKAQYTYSISNGAAFGGAAIDPQVDFAGGSLTTDLNVSNLFGQKVKVIYKNDTKKTVYGIYAEDSNVVLDGVVGALPTMANDAKSFKYDGTIYNFETDAQSVKVYEYNEFNGDAGTGSKLNTYKDATTNNVVYSIKLIDNNDNNKIDAAVVVPVTLKKVSFVGTESITAGVSYKYSENKIAEGLAKDDFVVITSEDNVAEGITTIEKVEKVSGTITALRSGNEYCVDGNWYTLITPIVGDALTLKIGNSVDVAVLNGYIIGGKVTDGIALSEVLYVAATTGTAGNAITPVLGEDKGVDVRVILPDGTNSVVKAMRVDTYSAVKDKTTIGAADTALIYTDANKTPAIPAVGLYSYTVNKNGVYELKAVKATTTGNYEVAKADVTASNDMYVAIEANLPDNTSIGTASTANNTFDKDSAKVGTYYISDDAVFYVIKNSTGTSAGTYDKATVISGKELKSMADFGDNADVLYKSVNGLNTVLVGVIYDNAALPISDASAGYGYVVADPTAQKNADGDWTVSFTVWNGEADVVLTTKVDGSNNALNATTAAAMLNTVAKGNFVSYKTTTTEGEVNTVAAYTSANEAAITGYDGGKNIALNNAGKTFKDDNKTVVIYVNTAEGVGVEGGSISLAQELASGVYVKNAVYADTAGVVDVLFVDVTNELATANYKITWSTASAGPVKGVSVSGTTVTFADGTAITSGTTDVKTGSNIKVAVAGSGTASADAVITVTVTLADTTTIVKTVNVANGATFSGADVYFTMPSQNVSSITVSVS